MLANRSVPVNTVLPHIVYSDVAAACLWLETVLGFTEQYRYGPPEAIDGAQLRREEVWIMLTRVRSARDTPKQLGNCTQMLTIFVADVDARYAHVTACEATIVEELNETIYGERQFVVEDIDGHHWIISTHARDVSPQDWGAITAPAHR